MAGFAMLWSMDPVTLTRQLVDIESITGNEGAVGNYLYGELVRLGYQARKMPVEGDRFNLYAISPGQANVEVVFSTHLDTVPPFIPSSEDAERIYGRGACDAKGIIAAQIAASERLRQQGIGCRWQGIQCRSGACCQWPAAPAAMPRGLSRGISESTRRGWAPPPVQKKSDRFSAIRRAPLS